MTPDMFILAVGAAAISLCTALGIGIKRQKDGMQRAFIDAIKKVGLTPKRVGDAWRSEGTLPDGRKFMLDLTPTSSSPATLCLMGIHINNPGLLPLKSSFHIKRTLSQKTLLAPSAMVDIVQADASARIEAHPWFEEFFPTANAELHVLEAYELEPLNRLRYEKGWLSLERSILDDSISQRNLKGHAELVKFFHGMISQALQAASLFEGEVASPGQLWWRTFIHAEPFSKGRTEALKALLGHHGDSEEAELAWRHVLEQGNLYDVLYIINHHQRRALDELSEDRLVAFANAVLQQGDLDPTSLPKLIGQRLDMSVLSKDKLDWRARLALLELWMLSARGEVPELTEAVAALLGAGTRSRFIDICASIERAGWIGAAGAIARVAPGEDAQIHELLEKTWGAIIRKNQEELQGREDVEAALLRLLAARRSSEVIELLGLIGGKSSIPHLHALVEGAALTVVGIPRDAKRAIDAIVERLGEQTRGALSVSSDLHKGQLSIMKGEVGALTGVEEGGGLSAPRQGGEEADD